MLLLIYVSVSKTTHLQFTPLLTIFKILYSYKSILLRVTGLIRFKVSAFSTWEKELHKIVFDPRYLLLTSKERKQVFEKYVKERAEEERREKRNKMKERKEQFQKLLEEAGLHGKYVQREHFFILFVSVFLQKILIYIFSILL